MEQPELTHVDGLCYLSSLIFKSFKSLSHQLLISPYQESKHRLRTICKPFIHPELLFFRLDGFVSLNNTNQSYFCLQNCQMLPNAYPMSEAKWEKTKWRLFSLLDLGPSVRIEMSRIFPYFTPILICDYLKSNLKTFLHWNFSQVMLLDN